MSTAVALLQSRHTTPAAQDRAQEFLGRQVNQMATFVNDLVESTRTKSGMPTVPRAELGLDDSVRLVVAHFGDADKFAHLRWSVALEPVVVPGDARRLEQVVSSRSAADSA